MSIAVRFTPAAMTAALYDEGIQRINAAGLGVPEGRLYHASFGPADKLQIFDIWESEASFGKFGEQLATIAAEVNIDLGAPLIEPVHHVIPGPVGS